MASASSSSARHLFSDSKKRLCDRIGVNINNLGSVARQVVRSSKSNEMLAQAMRNFTQVDIISEYSNQNLCKMELIRQHVAYQYDAMEDSVNHLEYLREQVNVMER